MKKLTRSHRLRNSFQLFFIVLFILIFIIFKDIFIELTSKSPAFITYMFFGSILIGIIIILYTNISELIKSKSKIKEDYKHLKQISEIEKEIEKIQ